MEYESVDDIAKVIRSYLGEQSVVEISINENDKLKINMNPLTVNDLSKVYELFKIYKGIKNPPSGEITPEMASENASIFMDNMTPQMIDRIIELSLKAIMPNYPDLPETDMKMLIARNAATFVQALIEQNMQMSVSTDKMSKIREKQELVKKLNKSGSQ